MKKLLLFIVVFQSFWVSAQNNLILTEEQNTLWFNQLKSKNLASHLKQIKQRMLNDTNVYVVQSVPHFAVKKPLISNTAKENDKLKAFCKPIYMIYYTHDNQTEFSPLEIKNNRLIAAFKILQKKNIYQVDVLTEENATAIYGTRGLCGVIILKTNKKEVWEAFTK